MRLRYHRTSALVDWVLLAMALVTSWVVSVVLARLFDVVSL